MATCPRCGKKMMQEAEACDLCWLKSDLSQAEKHIAELEIRAENAERKRDEAKARAAKAEAARLDADLQVARDQLRIADLEAQVASLNEHVGNLGGLTDEDIELTKQWVNTPSPDADKESDS